MNAKADAGDVFTCLIPLGASEIGEDGEYTEPVSIASVNNGLNYIQDDAAVALYGKIWRSKTWSYIGDPAQLLARGREYLKTGIAFESITLKAIDMHFVNGNVQPIRIGDKVRIKSDPHGIDKVMVCSQIEIDLLNPENTQYTFGEKPRTLTENVVRAETEVDELTGRGGGGGGGRSVKDELKDIIRWAEIMKDEERSTIELLAGKKFKEIDGSESLHAVSLVLNGDDGLIQMAVRKNDIISCINQTAEEIQIMAEKISLDGHTTISAMRAEIADINSMLAGEATISSLSCTNFRLGGHSLYKKQVKIDGTTHYLIAYGLGD